MNASATASSPTLLPTRTPLQLALDDFNLVFDRTLATPILPEHVELCAEFAALRGRQDIADGLRQAVAHTLENQD